MLGILGALLFSTTATLESDTRVQLPPSHQLMIAGPVQALTDEQFIVAEAWHLVDRKFVDHAQIQNDWNKLRLKYLRRSYRSMDDAHQAIRDMLRTLGDPYTRFLSPAEFISSVIKE
jgi:C-terminal processing protease CtpA/Prc